MPGERATVDLRVLTCVCRLIQEWRHANLSAPYWRVYWNAEPGWSTRLARRTVPLTPDRLVVIPPETPFVGHSTSPSHHLYVHFVAAAPYNAVRPGLYTSALTEPLRSVVHELAGRAEAGTVDTARGDVLLRALCYHALTLVPGEDLAVTPHSSKVKLAIDHLEGLLGRKVTNPELARAVGMSTNALIRLFSTQTGQSPQEWYLRRRIEYACLLLHHTAHSVKRIAQETGFCDRAHFSKAFARSRGMGPAMFRKAGLTGG